MPPFDYVPGYKPVANTNVNLQHGFYGFLTQMTVPTKIHSYASLTKSMHQSI